MSKILRIALLMGACAVAFLFAGAHPHKLGKTDEGAEWLVWSPVQREIYVRGFIEGYWGGTGAACRLADDLFEVGQSNPIGKSPSGRCEVRVEQYTRIKSSDSGPDFGAYTAVITEFYSKHPEYQNIPKSYILSFLSDARFKTSDQLYQMALKGELRTKF